MLRKTNIIFLIFHILVILFVSISLLLSMKSEGFRKLIEKITGENSFFEIAIFFLLLMISTFAMLISFNDQKGKAFTKARRHFISFIAICFYFIAMQEVRWGQLLAGKNSAGQSENLKGIVNLNRITGDGNIHAMVHLMILFGFIFLPLVIYYLPSRFHKNTLLGAKTIVYQPSLHCILMFVFACALQALIDPMTKFDHFILLLAFISIAGLMIYKKKLGSAGNVLHFCLVSGSALLIWIYAEYIPLAPDHYHLGKLVVVYAFFYWLYNWTITLKEKVNVKLNG